MLTKIMTFNLRVYVQADGENAWPYRVKAVAEAIRRHEPDIIGVQEGLRGMIEDLEPLLPEYVWIGEGREGGSKGEHTAIFYKKNKFDVESAGHFGLSDHPERPGVMSWNTAYPRMCTWAVFRSETVGRLAMFNTHLDNISGEAQRKGMELIRVRMKELLGRTGIPAVLTGDFNVQPDHEVIAGLEQEGYHGSHAILEQNGDVGATYHAFHGGESGERIDYIFLTPDLGFRSVIVDRGLYDGRLPSDHYPVVAEVSQQ